MKKGDGSEEIGKDPAFCGKPVRSGGGLKTVMIGDTGPLLVERGGWTVVKWSPKTLMLVVRPQSG